MRDTTGAHLANLNTAKEKGSYGGYLLPVGTDDGHPERAQELAHLTNLVLDDDLREEVRLLRSEMHTIGLGAPRSIEEGESEYLRLIDQYESVQIDATEAIRSRWAPLGAAM